MDWKNILSKYMIGWHLIAVVSILVVNIIYFYPQLEGKMLNQGDLIASKAKSSEVELYKTKEKDFFLWTNSQFSGMPRMMNAPVKNNILAPLKDILSLGFDRPIGVFNVLAISCYFLFFLLGIHPLLSLLIAIATALNVNNVILWDAGHASKVNTLAFTPIIVIGVWYIFEKHKFLLGGLIFTIGFGISLYARHPQMTYYVFMVFFIYGIIKFIQTVRSKNWKPFLLGVGVLFISVLLSLGSAFPRLASLYEYNKSSMRGAPILKAEIANTETRSSSEVEGLDWNYAMQWSNGLIDLIACYIPGAAGGGSSEKVSTDSEFYRKYRQTNAPLYWGELPFTSGPIYLGAVLLFLFIFGLFFVKGPIKWWLGLGVLLTLLVSMGKHLEFFNRLLFDYLPLYNKFRTPQSILSVTIFFIPVLGVLALHKVYKERGKRKKKGYEPNQSLISSLYWSTGLMGGFALLMWLLGPTIFTFEAAGDARYAAQGVDVSALVNDRISLFRQDAFRSLVFVLITSGLIWLYVYDKMKSVLLCFGLIGLLALIDNWTVSKRYLSHDDFVNSRQYNQNFEPRPVDQQILNMEQNRYEYRVFDMSVNTFNSTLPSTFHNHVGGYHPAKLQRYQDLIDRHISRNNMAVLNMLNTKYFIVTGQNGQAEVQRNPNALGNAWSVQTIKYVDSPQEEINALSNIDPAKEAVLLRSEFQDVLGSFKTSSGSDASIQITDYNPEKITYSVSSSQDELIIFSEIWYGPNLGWQAYIDGEPVEHLRANYVLRALPVPSGQHEIVFEFKPDVYYKGEAVSLASSILILLAAIGVFYISYRKRRLA